MRNTFFFHFSELTLLWFFATEYCTISAHGIILGLSVLSTAVLHYLPNSAPGDPCAVAAQTKLYAREQTPCIIHVAWAPCWPESKQLAVYNPSTLRPQGAEVKLQNTEVKYTIMPLPWYKHPPSQIRYFFKLCPNIWKITHIQSKEHL